MPSTVDGSTPIAGNDTYATDYIGGMHYQRVKMTWGVDNTATDASASAPMPITQLDLDTGLVPGMTTLRDLVTAQRYTVLADSIADGLATFWAASNANGGTATVAVGEGAISTGVATNGTAQLVSTNTTYLPGQVTWFNSAIRLGDTGTASNTRRWGAFTVSGVNPQDGFYYELAGTTLSAVTAKAGVITSTAVGSWSKFSTAPLTLDLNYHSFEIRWTSNRADFYVDNVLRHTATGGATSISSTLNFPMTVQSINSGNTTDRVLYVRNIGIGRFGTPPISTFGSSAASVSLSMAPSSELLPNAAIVAVNANLSTGVATANSAAELTLNGASGVALGVYGGSAFVGTLIFQVIVGSGAWQRIAGVHYGAAVTSWNGTSGVAADGNGVIQFNVAGATKFRVTANAYTSGSASIDLRATQGGGAVNLASTDLGYAADTSASSDTGAFSLIALTKRLLSKFTAQLPAALGSATSAASLAVVIASDQAAVNVTQQVSAASGNVTTQNLVPAGAATAGSAVEITLSGNTSLAIQTTGTYTGALSLQLTVDGTSWITIGGVPLINLNTGGYLASITSALVSVFQADVGGFIKARVTGLAAMTGTATVTLRASSNPSMMALDAALPTGANSIGNLGTVTTVGTVSSVTASTPTASTTTAATLSSAASTNATSVKTSAGNLYSIAASNVGAAAAFLKIYNKASAPTVGTDVPVLTIPIAASGVAQVNFGSQGFRMGTGIAFSITNLAADSDATAIAAAQVKVMASYI